MKKRRLIEQCRRIAGEGRLVRQGSGHEVWQFGRARVIVPRHNEINELTAKSIIAKVEEDA